MNKIIWKGKEYEADTFEIKDGVVSVNGYAIESIDCEQLYITGTPTLSTDKTVVFNEDANDITLTAKQDVVFNKKAGNITIINAGIVVFNREANNVKVETAGEVNYNYSAPEIK